MKNNFHLFVGENKQTKTILSPAPHTLFWQCFISVYCSLLLSRFRCSSRPQYAEKYNTSSVIIRHFRYVADTFLVFLWVEDSKKILIFARKQVSFLFLEPRTNPALLWSSWQKYSGPFKNFTHGIRCKAAIQEEEAHHTCRPVEKLSRETGRATDGMNTIISPKTSPVILINNF